MAEESLTTDLTVKAEINLYYDLFVPEKVSAPAPLLIAVHGYGMNKRYMMREARAIVPDGFVIASLQGPHQHFQRSGDSYKTGFAWLTDYKSVAYVTRPGAPIETPSKWRLTHGKAGIERV